ncbi:hypothetical protein ARMGADRAFT_1084207 [Armillaria gallica]|uniref:Uncharacterized protein n=1 Tax=Armillaria gallica TaxID=47427 RepID=A0A2H3D1F8_ARMGA|nr:hypothetical protein ARMGADRAFT_1084207 [Armillaria gallica]
MAVAHLSSFKITLYKSLHTNNEFSSMSRSHVIKKEDLLRNLGTFSGTLSFNDGHFQFIPSPPTTNEVHLCADGHFGEHDYSHVPQYYEEAYCHLPLIPRQPTGILDNHPYLDYTYMWESVSNKDIKWAAGSVQGICLLRRPWCECLSQALNHIDSQCGDMLADKNKSSEYHDLLHILHSHLQAVLDRLAHVAVDTFTVQVLVATAQRFWLEIIAALDYMDWVKPVMDGIKPPDPACKAEHCIGMFTWDVGAAQLYFKA